MIAVIPVLVYAGYLAGAAAVAALVSGCDSIKIKGPAGSDLLDGDITESEAASDGDSSVDGDAESESSESDAKASYATLRQTLPFSPTGYYIDKGVHRGFSSENNKTFRWNGAGAPVIADRSKIDGMSVALQDMFPAGEYQLLVAQADGYPGIAAVENASDRIARAEVRKADAKNAVTGIYGAMSADDMICFSATLNGVSGGKVLCPMEWPEKSLSASDDICYADLSNVPTAMAVSGGMMLMLVGDKVAKIAATEDAVCSSESAIPLSISLGGDPTINRIVPFGSGHAAVAIGSSVAIIDAQNGSVSSADTGARIADIAAAGSSVFALHDGGEVVSVASDGGMKRCVTGVSGASRVAADADAGTLFVLSGPEISEIDQACFK